MKPNIIFLAMFLYRQIILHIATIFMVARRRPPFHVNVTRDFLILYTYFYILFDLR